MNEAMIPVIENDKGIQNLMKISLKTGGYACILAGNGLSDMSLLYADYPDLILLDLGLPNIDGMEVLCQIRRKSDVPIIMISVRGQEWEKIGALDQGADDYVTKPFSAEELLARTRVGLRYKSSTMNHQKQELCPDYFRLDSEKRKLYVHDQEVHLTPLEYKMMVLLVNNSGKVLTHHYIQQEVWGCDTTDDYQSPRVFMVNIRRKIEDSTANSRFILTEVGMGYRSVDEQKEPKGTVVQMRSRIYREAGVRRGRRASIFLNIFSGSKVILKKSPKLTKLIP